VNLGTSDDIRIRDLAEMILRITRYRTQIVFDKGKTQGVRSRKADISKARNLLGWIPEVTLEDGLRRTVDWYLRSLHNE